MPSPSNYCIGPTYRRCQCNPKQAVHDRCVGTAIPMELLHPCFRTFTYWSFLEPYLFPRPHWEMSRQIDKSAFICVYQTIYQLLFSMPVFYTAHDDCVEEFKKALLIIFPDNDKFQWYANVPVDQGLSEGTRVRYKVDLVYQCKKTLIPLIFVEVKLEMGKGGNAFWQNQTLPIICKVKYAILLQWGTSFLCSVVWYDLSSSTLWSPISKKFTSRYTSWDRWGLLRHSQQQ